MRYFLNLGFDGSRYHGWQWQPNVQTVQQTIEDACLQVLGKKTTVYGCGRTDMGVHASQYIAHIDIDTDFDFDLKFRLNKNLPSDIAIHEVIPVKSDRHSRYDATARSYDYFIHTYKDPVLSNYSSFYELDMESLDVDAMINAASMLTQFDDFRSLCKAPDQNKHTICKVSFAKLYLNDTFDRFRFSITANRFLQNMIRICVYFFLEIGQGKMSLDEFEHMVSKKLEVKFKKAAYPNGLYLSRVEYPYLAFEDNRDFSYFLTQDLRD